MPGRETAITIRLTETDKRKLEQVAKAASLPAAAWARMVVMQRVKEVQEMEGGRK